MSLAVPTGFYILELAVIDQFLSMRGLNETNQGVPFVTTDGNFRVLDGGANENFANTLLPAFSVSTTVVPLPAALPLLGNRPGCIWTDRLAQKAQSRRLTAASMSRDFDKTSILG